MGTTLFSSPVLCNENPSFLFKAQAAGKIHSSFYSLSSAINASTGAYVLESANKLFGEKSSRFKEVSETCNLSGRAPNLQQVHFQSCSLWFIQRESEFHTGSLRLPRAIGHYPMQLSHCSPVGSSSPCCTSPTCREIVRSIAEFQSHCPPYPASSLVLSLYHAKCAGKQIGLGLECGERGSRDHL